MPMSMPFRLNLLKNMFTIKNKTVETKIQIDALTGTKMVF